MVAPLQSELRFFASDTFCQAIACSVRAPFLTAYRVLLERVALFLLRVSLRLPFLSYAFRRVIPLVVVPDLFTKASPPTITRYRVLLPLVPAKLLVLHTFLLWENPLSSPLLTGEKAGPNP